MLSESAAVESAVVVSGEFAQSVAKRPFSLRGTSEFGAGSSEFVAGSEFGARSMVGTAKSLPCVQSILIVPNWPAAGERRTTDHTSASRSLEPVPDIRSSSCRRATAWS